MNQSKKDFQLVDNLLFKFRPNCETKGKCLSQQMLSSLEIKAYSKIRPVISIFHIFKEYFFIFVATYICHFFFNPILYFFVVIWIGARQHALGIIGHDVVHFRLFENKKLNDFFGNILCLMPLFITVEGYRREHLSHHRYVDTEYDIDLLRTKNYPQYIFPQSKWQFNLNIIKHLLGFYTLRDFYNLLIKCKFILDVSKTTIFTMVCYYAGLLSIVYFFELWLFYVMYWVVPSCTMLVACLYWRLIGEHYHVKKDALFNTRNIYTNWWENLLIAPHHVNYHLDHHLFPSVPFYYLPKLHHSLLKSETYRNNAFNINGYSSQLIKEITEHLENTNVSECCK